MFNNANMVGHQLFNNRHHDVYDNWQQLVVAIPTNCFLEFKYILAQLYRNYTYNLTFVLAQRPAVD